MRRTGAFSRINASGAPRRAGTAVRNGSDADVIYYLNSTRLPVIGTESQRANLSELNRPPHRKKWPQTGATGATRCAGTRCVTHKACI